MKSLLAAESFVEHIDRYFIVDVRSPGEFAESHIPGAVNFPLFTDEERAMVGTTYWQEGTDRAKLVGLSLVSPRLPEMVEGILKGAAGRDVVLYCWRGGMRSRSVFTIMEALGYPVWQLIGGFKAFRRLVVNYFKDAEIRVPVFVLNGLTGVGKTLVLNELHTLGAPVLDLEGMANHRGSAFGAVGLGSPRSQKDFDALLYLALRRLEQAPYLIVEGEGKKIGPVILPDFLYDAMQNESHILLEASLDIRVERILQEYQGILDNTEELAIAVLALQKRLGRVTCEGLAEQIRQGEFANVARTLCTDYYDLYYRDSRRKKAEYFAVVNVNDLQAGAREILSLTNGSVRGGWSNDGTV